MQILMGFSPCVFLPLCWSYKGEVLLYVHLECNSLSHYAVGSKLTIIVVFLFQEVEDLKPALSKKMDNTDLRAVIPECRFKLIQLLIAPSDY